MSPAGQTYELGPTTREVRCVRCHEPRWTSRANPYTCQRCREALTGSRFVVDPLPSPAQRRAREAAGERLSARGMEDLLAWRALQGRPATGIATPVLEPSSAPAIPDTSSTANRRLGSSARPLTEASRRLNKTTPFGGRPRVPLIEQRQKARDRDRAYRARRTARTESAE